MWYNVFIYWGEIFMKLVKIIEKLKEQSLLVSYEGN